VNGPGVPQQRDLALDGIRGVAILLVMFFHLIGFCDAGGAPAGSGLMERALRIAAGEGWAGVDLFFVLSGFLITGILIRTKNERLYFKNFYARRSLRIFPLYYLFVLVMFVILPRALPSDPHFKDLPSNQFWSWTYLVNFQIFLSGKWVSQGHIWSLAIEEQFYWMWPLVIYFLSLKQLRSAACAILISQTLIRALLLHEGFAADVVPVFTFARLDALMAGALIAIVVMGGASRDLLKRMAVGLFLSGAAIRIIAMRSHLPYSYVRYDFYITAYALLFAGFVALSRSLPAESTYNRALGNRLLVFFGKYSYGIYLIHHPIGVAVCEHLDLSHHCAIMGWIIAAGAGSALILPIAWLVFHLYEMPFLKLKERFSQA